MGGGRKKPTISQLEKRMSREKGGRRKKGGEEKKFEMALNAAGELTQFSMDQIIGEVRKMKYVTPYLLHEKFKIKISRAKKVLRTLEEKGVVKAVDRNKRVPIYVPS